MSQDDLIKLHSLLSKLELAATEVAQLEPNFKKQFSDSIQTLTDFSAHLNDLEEGLKTARVIQFTFRDAN